MASEVTLSVNGHTEIELLHPMSRRSEIPKSMSSIDLAIKNTKEKKPLKAAPSRPKPVPVGQLASATGMDIVPKIQIPTPNPTVIDDASTGNYKFRCVCGKADPEGFLVQCETCNCWMHSRCVGYGQCAHSGPFLCPFCSVKPIKCSCNDASDYSQPLIQCKSCHLYVHKACAGLGYGRNPPFFLCQNCGGGPDYAIEYTRLQSRLPVYSTTVYPDINLLEVLEAIPEGIFKNFVESDLCKSEWVLGQMVERYFNAFIAPFFSEDKSFWKAFITLFTKLFHLRSETLCYAIDELACTFIYENAQPQKEADPQSRFEVSERANEFIQPSEIKEVHQIQSKLVEINGAVCVEKPFEEGEIICTVPGTICVNSEMETSQGLRKEWITIQDSELVIDTSKTGFNWKIRRSFHSNCMAKIVKIGEDPVVALIATKTLGPTSELATKKGPTLFKGDEVILPLDGGLPFNVPRQEWFKATLKSKKSKSAPNLDEGSIASRVKSSRKA